jgi:hypothetical protein
VSWDDAVWVVEPVDVAALLPAPSRWRRYDHEDFTCWEFDGERWLIHVCDWEPVGDLAEVPDRTHDGGLEPSLRWATATPVRASRGASE